MDNEKIGKFIAELRKSKQMTQKNLAEKLNITDKAVSKWERGLSYPDISLLSSIAEILGVTTGELLKGERNVSLENIEVSIGNALQYADKSTTYRVKSILNVCAGLFSLLMLLGIVICAICDLVISGRFTWSCYPISSIIFAWLVLFPVIKYGAKGVTGTLIALTVFIIPFLYVLDSLVTVTDLILPVGITSSIIALLYVWVVYALFRILRNRKLLACAISLLLIIPMDLLIDLSITRITSEPTINVWNMVEFFTVVMVAAPMLISDYRKHRR